LIAQLLDPDYETRMSVQQAMEHPFLKQFNILFDFSLNDLQLVSPFSAFGFGSVTRQSGKANFHLKTVIFGAEFDKSDNFAHWFDKARRIFRAATNSWFRNPGEWSAVIHAPAPLIRRLTDAYKALEASRRQYYLADESRYSGAFSVERQGLLTKWFDAFKAVANVLESRERARLVHLFTV